jgi:hypothetical protein
LINIYWIVDVLNDGVEVQRGPTSHGFLQVETKHRGDLLLPGVAVDDVLPRR